VNRQLLLPRFGSNQNQIRDVRARDQQDEADGAEEHPEHASDIADHIGRERPHIGPDLDVVEHLAREAGRHREPIRDDRDEARDVGVCLLQRNARLQPGHAAVAEVGRVQFRPVEAERQDELRVAIEEAEPGGEHSDNLARLAVDDDRLAYDGLIAAELAFPVRVAQEHALGCFQRVVVGREVAPQDRVDVEEAQRAVRHEECLDAFGFAGAGD
jgi:hypothetical protein